MGGYDTRVDLVAGIQRMVREKAVRVVSLHNICPVPMGVPLRVRFRAGGMTWRRTKKTLRTSVSGPGGVADDDRMRLVCLPAVGTTPCDGAMEAEFRKLNSVVTSRRPTWSSTLGGG